MTVWSLISFLCLHNQSQYTILFSACDHVSRDREQKCHCISFPHKVTAANTAESAWQPVSTLRDLPLRSLHNDLIFDIFKSVSYFSTLVRWRRQKNNPISLTTNCRNLLRFPVTIFVTGTCFSFLHRAIAMIFSRELFKRWVVFSAIFRCGLMFIGIVILQAWPNESISQSSTYNLKRTILQAKMMFKLWP